MASAEFPLSCSITIVSVAFTVATTVIAMYLISHFVHDGNIPKRRNSDHKRKPKSDNVKIKRYFKLSASITLIFNALNAFFNTIYCMNLLLDPVYDDTVFYVYHPSHIHRITSTVSWYIAKVSLVWFFTGRLYHAFKGSALRINGKMMLFINIFNTIFAPFSLFVAYWSVYHQSNLLHAEFAFNIWRMQYQIVIIIILIMFSKRLLFLTEINIQIQSDPSKTETVSDNMNVGKIDDINVNSKSEKNKKKHRVFFLMVTTRNSLLVLTINFTVLLVAVCFTGFRFIFGKQTRLTLLIPLNMASFDSLITSICLICLFQIGDNVYKILCKICDRKIYALFILVAKMQMTHSSVSVINTSKIKPQHETELQLDNVEKKPVKRLSLENVISNSFSISNKANKGNNKEIPEKLMNNDVKPPVLQLSAPKNDPVKNTTTTTTTI